MSVFCRYTIYGEKAGRGVPEGISLLAVAWTEFYERAVDYAQGAAHEDWGAYFSRFKIYDEVTHSYIYEDDQLCSGCAASAGVR